MGPTPTWEMLATGVLVLLVLLWMRPGIKRMLQESREAEKDWRGVLIPIALVVLFVLLLIASVRQ